MARFDGKEWQSFNTKDGLGDANAYAIASDRLGRVWVGHLNHGVSVWNGQGWKNYGVLDGPLGERVFAIATSPADGDVWMATNAGLSRYSLKNDDWTHYTRATGLPTTDISCLAFDSLGRLFVGTQCEGLLVSGLDDDFTSWRWVKGATTLPLGATGTGLPSNFINDVLIADDDTIYVATNTGLAQSKDGGEAWTYLRGLDWEAKAKGLWKGAAPEALPNNLKQELLREDYITNLAEDERGLLWIGYRMKGYEVRRPLSDRVAFLSPEATGDFPYVSTMVPLGDGSVALGYYNAGLKISETVPAFTPNKAEKKALAERRGWKGSFDPDLPIAPFPKVAGQPSEAELTRLLKFINERKATPADAPPIVALSDDWTTQGDWRGRYGRYHANLNAMLAPRDYSWGAGKEPVYYSPRIGPNATSDDSLRYWVHSLYTDNRRSLEMPTIYFHSRLKKNLTEWPDDPTQQKYRRQSEWDDHGEEYPMEKDGPHVFVTLRIPHGMYFLSLYNHNKDGHDGSNRARDYKISIRPHDWKQPLAEIAAFDSQPEWVRGRWRDFWGGNWKRYVVKGGQEVTIQLNRNYSHNTILAGWFLDEISEEPEPYFDAPTPNAQPVNWFAASKIPQDEAASRLWDALEKTKTDDVFWWAANGRLFQQALARHFQLATLRTDSTHTPELQRRLGASYYGLNLFPQWEQMQEKRGLKTARSIEKSLTWDEKSNVNGYGRTAIVAHRTGKTLVEAILEESTGCNCGK